MEYLDVKEAKTMKDFKEILENLNLKAEENPEMEDYHKYYCFVLYNGCVFQVKNTDNINLLKDEYTKRSLAMKDEDKIESIDQLFDNKNKRNTRSNNRLLDRIQNFVELNRDSVNQAEYYSELRLISMQINQRSFNPCFPYRSIIDILRGAGYEVLDHTTASIDDFNSVINFMIGQILYVLESYTISSKKFNKVFNEMKKFYEKE